MAKWIGHDKKTNEEHDKDCAENWFHLGRGKLGRGGEGART